MTIAFRLAATAAMALVVATAQCQRPLDFVFVVDESGSVTAPNFQLVRQFLVDISDDFVVSADVVRMGLIKFSSSVTPSIPLGSINNQSQLAAAFLALSYDGGSTNTWLGLNAAVQQLEQFGRPVGTGAARVIMVITDGRSNSASQTIAAANLARANASATVSVVTIGDPNNFNAGEVEGMVGGNNDLIVSIEQWSEVGDSSVVLGNITRIACDAATQIDDLDTVDAVITCNATWFVNYRPRSGAPITLYANVTAGGEGGWGVGTILWLWRLAAHP